MPIIDTPAEGFPLPTMTPPTRTLRDVAARLTPGGRARAMQRAENIAIGSRYLEDGILPPVDMFDREVGIGRPQHADPHLEAAQRAYAAHGSSPVFPLDVLERADRDEQIRDVWSTAMHNVAAEREQLTRSAFADGRAYERGAALRRNVGAKSLGSRRVQAQGVAADYLRDDPQDGPRLAALVLAGFMGQDPEAVR